LTWRTSPLAISARNFGRAIGVNRLLAPMLNGSGYEERFHAALMATIRHGDVVWDVGANVGLYSILFAQQVGSEGMVVAWEPSPTNLPRLHSALLNAANAMVRPIALGDRQGTATLILGKDSLGATSRIIDSPESTSDQGVACVSMASGDELVGTGDVPSPIVIKIDTEGFELEVLRGLTETLRRPSLRAVCVELHFAILHERGLLDVPAQIEGLLFDAGLTVSWPDASHIVATRSR
jgi:FkbM family methyltransferase